MSCPCDRPARFGGLYRSREYAIVPGVTGTERRVMSPHSSAPGLRGMQPDYYGGPVEMSAAPDGRVSWKSDSITALAVVALLAAATWRHHRR